MTTIPMWTARVHPVERTADDADVIRRSLTEPDHFTVLYDRHAPAIHRYAARRLGSDVADDLMAETFLIAFRKRRSYDLAYPNARPWLYGIVTRLIARHRKAETAQYRLLARLGGQAVAGPATADPTEHVLPAPLARALAEVPRGARDVLLLVAWADLSYEEVATALGVPTGTVRSRLSRARARLRAALGDDRPTDLNEESDHG